MGDCGQVIVPHSHELATVDAQLAKDSQSPTSSSSIQRLAMRIMVALWICFGWLHVTFYADHKSRHQYILEVHPSHANAGVNLQRMGFKRLPFSPHPINEATNTSALDQSTTLKSKHYMCFAFIKGLQPAHIMGLFQVAASLTSIYGPE
ncbi:hypothetical protein AX14_009573 [Amanita brunnescens Koide BX004]|nr:hypothetical protein AX14_009573 [Amanita brunnescens Koide BX004]